MPKAKTRPLTRQKSDGKFGGGPSELSTTEPSFYRQLIIRYYYHLKNTDPQSSISQYCQQIKDMMGIWQSASPRLSLISTLSIEKRYAAVGKRYESKTQ